MKTNATFYEAVDWQKTHGYDFYKQFTEDEWNSAGYYVQEVSNGRSKKEVLNEVRNNKFTYNEEFWSYEIVK